MAERMPATAEELIRMLELVPHPEGGFFRETFRAPTLPFELPGRGARSASTAIFFLLRSGDFSAFHSVRSDEVWHHYEGAPVELHTLDPDSQYRLVLLGPNVAAGELPQRVVPADVYQAARVTAPGFALCGCTVAPGFDFADFDMPPRAELIRRFPAASAIVSDLTRH